MQQAKPKRRRTVVDSSLIDEFAAMVRRQEDEIMRLRARVIELENRVEYLSERLAAHAET